MSAEIWKPIPDLLEYEASSFGNIRSVDRIIKTSSGQVRKYKGKIIKQDFNKVAGYFYVKLKVAGIPYKERLVHRIIAHTFHGKPEGKEVDHKDKNRKNNKSENLQWISRIDHADKDGSKEFVFLNPEGEVIVIKNLEKFCRENNLRSSNMHDVFTGRNSNHKGWRRHES